jgi:hypothetical protein
MENKGSFNGEPYELIVNHLHVRSHKNYAILYNFFFRTLGPAEVKVQLDQEFIRLRHFTLNLKVCNLFRLLWPILWPKTEK